MSYLLYIQLLIRKSLTFLLVLSLLGTSGQMEAVEFYRYGNDDCTNWCFSPRGRKILLMSGAIITAGILVAIANSRNHRHYCCHRRRFSRDNSSSSNSSLLSASPWTSGSWHSFSYSSSHSKNRRSRRHHADYAHRVHRGRLETHNSQQLTFNFSPHLVASSSEGNITVIPFVIEPQGITREGIPITTSFVNGSALLSLSPISIEASESGDYVVGIRYTTSGIPLAHVTGSLQNTVVSSHDGSINVLGPTHLDVSRYSGMTEAQVSHIFSFNH